MTRSAFENALDAGLRTVSNIAGVEVIYTSGVTSVTISKAIPTAQDFGTLTDAGAEAVVDSLDFIIQPQLLPDGDPKVGDTILRVIGGTQYLYSVESPAPGIYHWELSTTYRGWYRIHVREAGTFKLNKFNTFDMAGNEVRNEGT